MISKKYSIIVPVYNGMPYLVNCLRTILSQSNQDFELIVSDDHSSDGAAEYLNTLSDPRLRVLYPSQGMSMTEHWEWALGHANGDWQIFVGQDDGLQGYFFELADRLTSLATSKGLRCIVSKRAYFFWPGCEPYYGHWKVNFAACNKLAVRSTWRDARHALFGGSYHDLPQMYTSSLFHKDLLDEAREKQSGCVFCAHPQDANLAAVACSLNRKYLYSDIPLGWVGSSVKSAGLAISSAVSEKKNLSDELKKLESEYKKKVENSRLEYNALAGDFSLGSTQVYFWQALLQTEMLRPSWLNRLILSKGFRFCFFSSVLANDGMWRSSEGKKALFLHLLSVNQLNPWMIALTARLVRLKRALLKVVAIVAVRAPRRVIGILIGRCFQYHVKHDSSAGLDMAKASESISSQLRRRRFI